MGTRLLAALALVATALPSAPPTPESHFGFRMGDDRKLVQWAKVVSYFEALQKSSDRILVRNLGRTTEGRPFIAAWIADPATLKDLERYRQIQKKLADPRITPEDDAAKLIAEGKSVVMITCSIHSTEVASTMTAVEFAWRLLAEDRPKFREILNNVVFILVPSLNPDGVDIVERWYAKTLGTPHEGTSPPELYQKYVGHDNNRDWYIFSQPETRMTISQLHNQWHPQIVYDVHQQGPYASRMFVPPWLDPIEPNIDPIITQMCNMIGAGIAADLTAAGKKGVAINAIYDFWTPARHYQAYHGGMRILTESASARLASPISVTSEQISENANGYLPRQSSWNHLEPWLGGTWRVRDIVDYQQIAWESTLWQAAVRRSDMLRNFYAVGKRAIARTAPYAFVVPAGQFDPGATKVMLDTLAFGLVEIDRAQDNFQAGGKQYAAGSYVIRMQQPYGSWAKALLEKQQYPDLRLYPGGPPRRPYDVTAHTLPLLMGVNVDAVAAPFEAKLTRAANFNELSASGMRARRTSVDWYRTASKARLGLYRSHMPSMDEGWTRWMLERFGWKYSSVGNAEILAGGLGAKYDVLLFPDQGAGAINNGYRPGSMPDEYVGGLGDKGASNLLEFAKAGGTLLFLNDSTNYAIGHLGVPLKSTIRGVSSRDFYSPGSLLNVRLDTSHPLTQGLPTEIAIWSEGSPAWDLASAPQAKAIARYVDSGVLASGWLLGERYLAGHSALVEYPMEKGRAILFGMRPQYRAQSYQTLKLLFNAMLAR